MLAQNSTPIRVFLIDDYRIVRWGLERLVEGAGMKVVGGSSSCAAALKLLDQANPDVIVLDLDLSDESVIDAIPQLIAKSEAKILVFTALRDKSLHDRAVLAGARGVMGKETPVDIVLTAIQKVHEGELWLDRAAAGRIFVEFSRNTSAAHADPDRLKISALTAREREVIDVTGSNNGAAAKAIAEKLHISEHTLRNHLTSIYDKLGVTNRLALFDFAQKHGLLKNPQ